jgi:hypothetical protein
VTDGHHTDAAGEVDELVAIDIDHECVVGVININRESG